MRREPQTDDHGSTSMPLIPVDPDHQPESEEQDYAPDHWERDEHGWIIVPGTGTMPPIWKE